MKPTICLLIGAALAIPAASAAIVATDDFTYADGALAGNAGGSGDWAAAWAGAGTVAAGKAEPTTNGLGTRELNTSFAGSSTVPLYFSAKFTKTGTAGAYALWLQIAKNAAEDPATARIGVADGKISMRLGGTNADFGTYNTGDEVLVVGKLLFDTDGTNETLTVWADPTGIETGPVSSTVTGTDIDWTTPNYVLIRNWLLADADGLIDDVKVGTEWSDVAPVPEPSAALLAMLGLALMRRRR